MWLPSRKKEDEGCKEPARPDYKDRAKRPKRRTRRSRAQRGGTEHTRRPLSLWGHCGGAPAQGSDETAWLGRRVRLSPCSLSLRDACFVFVEANDDLHLGAEVRSDVAAAAVFRQAASLMPLDAFVRSVAVNARVGHMLLLGAGASISSQVPSAARCVWQWKRSIFLSNHPGLESSFEELSLGTVQARIQTWLDQQPGFPTADAPEEYGFYIGRCYPVLDDRRSFFQRQVQAARPSAGYRLAARLAEAGLIRSAWTTNFDGLLPRALAETSVTPVEVGLDTAARVLRPDRAGELSCVALHGDYRYDALRNTDAETQRLDEALRQTLVERAREAPLIVLG
jgi:hypothetical protein